MHVTGYNFAMTDQAVLAAPIWVDTPRKFDAAIREFENEAALAVDTESNSLFAYQERVCLIQVSTPLKDFLIDPLAIADISALGSIFANPRQEKIFHASEYDLICLKRDFQFSFSNLFDTVIAARILGKPQFGLAPLLQELMGINVDKKFQRANWGMRPLSSVMLDYARLDSHYLFRLRNILKDELEQRGLLALAEDDFKLACNAKNHANGDKIVSCWKAAGSQPLDPQQAAILQELCRYRDEQARKMDLPLFKVLSNELLVSVCLQPPASLDDLKQVHGMNERMIRRHGVGLLQAVQRGLAMPPVRRQPRVRPDEKFVKRVEALKDWRKETGKELKVESDIILPREILEQIAARNPQTSQELMEIMQLVPWRFEHFGNSIHNVLKKLEVA